MRGMLDLHDPLYSEADVSRMLALPPSTLRRWTRGYNYKTVDGLHGSEAIVTTSRKRFGKTIPFIGLVEASVYASVRAAGVAVTRIRPAVVELQRRTGLIAALMSERLKTDGVELL